MTDLFSGNTPPIPVVDPNKNYLEELVGDGKKFRSPEDLARGKAEADTFITRLQQEMEGLRTELNTRLSMEQYLEKMTTNSITPAPTPTPNPNANTNDGNGNGNAPLTPEQIDELVNSRLTARDRERIQEQNLLTVRNELTEKFGNDYVTKLRELQQSIGADDEFISNLAKTNPKALLRMVGVGETQPAQRKSVDGLFAPPPSQMSTFSPASNKRDWNYYEGIRRKTPSEYWAASTQNQMHKDAGELGEAFYPS